jgi:hypothetical protein
MFVRQTLDTYYIKINQVDRILRMIFARGSGQLGETSWSVYPQGPRGHSSLRIAFVAVWFVLMEMYSRVYKNEFLNSSIMGWVYT